MESRYGMNWAADTQVTCGTGLSQVKERNIAGPSAACLVNLRASMSRTLGLGWGMGYSNPSWPP